MSKIGFGAPGSARWCSWLIAHSSLLIAVCLLLIAYLPLPPRSIGMLGLGGICDLILGLQIVTGKILGANELEVERCALVFCSQRSARPTPGCEGEEQAVFPHLVFKELGLSGVLAPKRSPRRTLGPWRLATRRGYFKLSEMGGEVSEWSHAGA